MVKARQSTGKRSCDGKQSNVEQGVNGEIN